MDNIRIGVFTTWNIRCGISTYSEELYQKINDSGCYVHILASNEMAFRDGPGFDSNIDYNSSIIVNKCWSRTGMEDFGFIFSIIERYKLNIVHFQHEDGLFMNNQSFIRLISFLKKKGIKIVVTLHTVRPSNCFLMGGFYYKLSNIADAIIFHSIQAFSSSFFVNKKAKFYNIHHGTSCDRVCSSIDDGFNFLELNDYYKDFVWCVIFGFKSENKNIESSIRAFCECKNRGYIGKCGLLICGSSNGSDYGLNYIPILINQSGYSDFIIDKEIFVDVDNVNKVMSIADFGILNANNNEILSSSGQVHLYASYNVPLIVADAPIYYDAVRYGAIPFQLNKSDIRNCTSSQVNIMASMYNNKLLRDHVKKNMIKLKNDTSWDKIANNHIDVYKDILND